MSAVDMPGFRRPPTNARVSAAARPARRMRSIWAGLRISIGTFRPMFASATAAVQCRFVLALVLEAVSPGVALPGGARQRQSRGVSLSQIQYFVAVAEEGHVGRAAQRLYVAQPAVSRQIRALEDEIGTPLFVRTPRGMTLLASGRVFLDRARRILAAVEDAASAARSVGSGSVAGAGQPKSTGRGVKEANERS